MLKVSKMTIELKSCIDCHRRGIKTMVMIEHLVLYPITDDAKKQTAYKKGRCRIR